MHVLTYTTGKVAICDGKLWNCDGKVQFVTENCPSQFHSSQMHFVTDNCDWKSSVIIICDGKILTNVFLHNPFVTDSITLWRTLWRKLWRKVRHNFRRRNSTAEAFFVTDGRIVTESVTILWRIGHVPSQIVTEWLGSVTNCDGKLWQMSVTIHCLWRNSVTMF